MMKRITAVLVVLSLLAFGSLLYAEGEMENAVGNATPMSDETTMNESSPINDSSIMEEYEDSSDGKYSFGVVTSVTDKEIVLKEYDYDKDEEIMVTYEFNQDTKFENAASLKDIAKDDEVEIYWTEKDGKNVATFIDKSEDSDTVPEEDAQAPSPTNTMDNSNTQ